MKVDHDEIIALAANICGTPDYDYDSEVETAFENKYGIDVDAFEVLMNDLMPLVAVGCSPLTGVPYVGFAAKYNWLSKKECQKEFIPAVIAWIGEGEVLTNDKPGYLKTITVSGKPKYDVILRNHKPDVANPKMSVKKS